jgi:hypothetical protein
MSTRTIDHSGEPLLRRAIPLVRRDDRRHAEDIFTEKIGPGELSMAPAL